MHPEAPLEEEPAVLRDRGRVPEEMLEHGHAGALRVDALRDLGELEGIAQEDHVPRGCAHGERVSERDLSGLVDDEVIELPIQLGPREEPGRAGEELDLRAGADNFRDVRLARDEPPAIFGLGVVAGTTS